MLPIDNQDIPEELKQHIEAFVKKFSDVTGEILNNYRDDRDEIGQTIKYLDGIVKGHPKVSQIYVEMLVSALRTKAENNTSIIKLLDSIAKLIAAGKGNQIFAQNTTIVGEDLEKLLSQKTFEDERTGLDNALDVSESSPS